MHSSVLRDFKGELLGVFRDLPVWRFVGGAAFEGDGVRGLCRRVNFAYFRIGSVRSPSATVMEGLR